MTSLFMPKEEVLEERIEDIREGGFEDKLPEELEQVEEDCFLLQYKGMAWQDISRLHEKNVKPLFMNFLLTNKVKMIAYNLTLSMRYDKSGLDVENTIRITEHTQHKPRWFRKNKLNSLLDDVESFICVAGIKSFTRYGCARVIDASEIHKYHEGHIKATDCYSIALENLDSWMPINLGYMELTNKFNKKSKGYDIEPLDSAFITPKLTLFTEEDLATCCSDVEAEIFAKTDPAWFNDRTSFVCYKHRFKDGRYVAV